MRAPYTCLYRQIWDDPRFYLLSEIGKLVYLYVLSTPLGNGLGCFKAGKAAMEEESRLLPERFSEGFAEGLTKGLFEYDNDSRVVLIPKYFNRNPPSNPNGIKALSKEFVKIPDCKLKNKCFHIVKEWIAMQKESFAEPFAELFAEPYAEQPGTISPSPSPSISFSLSYSSSLSEHNMLDNARASAAQKPKLNEELEIDLTDRQELFLKMLRETTFYVRGIGETKADVAIKNPVDFARRIGDADTYPAVHPSEIKRIGSWTLENRVKAKKDISRFIANWLNRAQEKGVKNFVQRPRPMPQNQQNRPYERLTAQEQAMERTRAALAEARAEVEAEEEAEHGLDNLAAQHGHRGPQDVDVLFGSLPEWDPKACRDDA